MPGKDPSERPLMWIYRGQRGSLEVRIILEMPIRPILTFLEGSSLHTIYIRNDMGQKCEGNCGLWVLNEILKKTNPENLKKNRGCRLGDTC